MPGKRCTNCPTILTNGTTTCTNCQRTKNTARGTRTQRGYGKQHQALRREWQQRINNNEHTTCHRCGKPITPNTPWDLGHTDNRQSHTGPEHTQCNRSAAGKHAAKLRNQ